MPVSTSGSKLGRCFRSSRSDERQLHSHRERNIAAKTQEDTNPEVLWKTCKALSCIPSIQLLEACRPPAKIDLPGRRPSRRHLPLFEPGSSSPGNYLTNFRFPSWETDIGKWPLTSQVFDETKEKLAIALMQKAPEGRIAECDRHQASREAQRRFSGSGSFNPSASIYE